MSFRTRLVTYFVVVHLALAGLGGWLVWTEPYALIGVEVALIASLAIGVGLVRRAIGYRALAADARRLVHDQAFTSRFLAPRTLHFMTNTFPKKWFAEDGA